MGMTITWPKPSFSFGIQSEFTGVRSIHFRRDVPQITELLHLAFYDKQGRERPSSTAFDLPSLWMLNVDPMTNRLGNGLVWVENGRIIGNLTIVRYPKSGRFLVVNVAVHPEWRRRGIARRLMDEVVAAARKEGQTAVLLQVDRSNESAQQLYRRMNFSIIGQMISWRGEGVGLRRVPSSLQTPSPEYVRRLHAREWKDALALDRAHLPIEMDWPEPMPHDLYKTGMWQWLFYAINGRSFEAWTMVAKTGELTGVSGIWGEWGQPFRVRMRIHPSWRGKVERPLFLKTVDRLSELTSRRIYWDHPDDPIMNELLQAAKFKPRRTLTHMELRMAEL